MTARDLLHHRADALGLLKCGFHHLLQVNAIAGNLRNLVAVLLYLAHVEQQRGQWPVELARDRGSGFIHRTVACGGKPDHFKIIVGVVLTLSCTRVNFYSVRKLSFLEICDVKKCPSLRSNRYSITANAANIVNDA